MRKNLLVPLAVSLLVLSNAYGQEKGEGNVCAELSAQTSATHRFRHVGEKIEIAIRGDGVSADCEPVALELHWANGRNNGSNFNVTFLDGNNAPIFARQISAFLTGVLHLPLSSFQAQPVYGSSLAMISVPTVVTIQAVPPFAAPASLSYTVRRVARDSGAVGRSRRQEVESKHENEVVSIHRVVRLIGSSRLQVVQMELRTSRPFPVRDVPLKLQIGRKVFSDELSGDHTGRKLLLSLAPEIFAELKDGDEIVAFFVKREGSGEGEVWNFGKLSKSVSSLQ